MNTDILETPPNIHKNAREYGLITPGEKRKNARGSYELSWLITSKGKQVAEMNDE